MYNSSVCTSSTSQSNGSSKIIEGPKSDPKFSSSSQGLATNEGVEVPMPGPREIPRELRSYDPGRKGTFHDISTSMLGLCHHQFTYHTIFIRLILKCCLAILMIWQGMGALLLKCWPLTRLASHADALCWQFELEVVVVVLMLVFMLRVLCFFQRNMEVPPRAQEDALEIPHVVRLICDVRLNIRIDTLQTYSIPKISPVVWRTWMVSFLSSWLKPTGDTGKIRYILGSSVFLQTTRQLDAWLLDMSTGGPWTQNMWFSSLRLLACEEGWTFSTGWKVRTGSSSHPIEPRLHGQALAAVLNETCIAELNFSRPRGGTVDAPMEVATVQAWCCKSWTVPASPERCKVQVLAKALESNDHVTHLNLDFCQIEVEGIKVGSLVWDPV